MMRSSRRHERIQSLAEISLRWNSLPCTYRLGPDHPPTSFPTKGPECEDRQSIVKLCEIQHKNLIGLDQYIDFPNTYSYTLAPYTHVSISGGIPVRLTVCYSRPPSIDAVVEYACTGIFQLSTVACKGLPWFLAFFGRRSFQTWQAYLTR